MLNLTKICLEHPAEVRVGCKPWSYEFMPAPDDIMNHGFLKKNQRSE